MKKLLSLLVAAAAVATVGLSSAQALTYDFGQLGSGDIYRVRNLSDNQTDFVKTANADLCETVQFKIRVHNAGPETLTNVKVKAALPSGTTTVHTSTVTVSADNNRDDAVATGSATVKLSKAGSLTYVAGSTELLDANSAHLSALGDTLFTSGVNIGSVNVSLNNMRFVQFKAKTNCETPQTNTIKVCELDSKKIVTIDENDFNAKKYSKDLSDCEEVVVTELPHTGIGSTVLAVLGLGALVASIAYYVQSRRNLLG